MTDAAKRAFDIACAIFGGIVLLPLIVALALAVRLTSPGPGLFQQVRVGREQRLFVCYKLRTMTTGTGDRPSHETAPSAITPLGKVLRRTKLDELPQLWNIVKGEMSFVGPRPCLPGQLHLIEARRARGVYSLRPGITGVAQVRGVDMSDPEALANLDALYLKQMSVRRDIQLIWQTVRGAGRGDAANKKAKL
jgi:O-antigen biosynthesis protein WbqP